MKVLLLGAGPTNLACADRLLSKGNFQVEILEAAAQAGGFARSIRRGPFVLDLGPHRFTPHTDEVYGYVKDILDGELEIVNQRVEIFLLGKFLKYPFSFAEVLSKLGFGRTSKMAMSFLGAGLSSPAAGTAEANYEEWVRRRFGREITEMVFKPLIGKVWGTPLDRLAARFAWQRIAISNLWEILFEILRGKRKEDFSSPYYPQNCFLYPKKGFGAIIDAMVERIRKKGGLIHFNCAAERIRMNGDTVAGVEAACNGKKQVFTGDWALSTVPVNLFVGMIEPKITAREVLDAVGALRFRSIVYLYLVVKKERVSLNTSFYFPGPQFPFGRACEQKNHSPWTVPGDPAHPRTAFTVELPCWAHDPIWRESDEAVFLRAMTALEQTGLFYRRDVEEYFTVRMANAYPVWDLPFEENLGMVLNYFKPVKNLILNGRPGLFFYNNMHHSLEMGFLAAEHILSGKPKAEKWEKDSELFKNYRLVE